MKYWFCYDSSGKIVHSPTKAPTNPWPNPPATYTTHFLRRGHGFIRCTGGLPLPWPLPVPRHARRALFAALLDPGGHRIDLHSRRVDGDGDPFMYPGRNPLENTE